MPIPSSSRLVYAAVALLVTACGRSGPPASSSTMSPDHVGPIAQGTRSYTSQVVNLRVAVGPDGQTLCNIVANLHKPSGVDAQHPAPAILAQSGFGGSKDGADGAAAQAAGDDKTGQDRLLQQLAKHGYVGLSLSPLGFGGSDCLIQMNDRQWDGKAMSQLAEFLGGKDGIAFREYDHVGGRQQWSDPIPGLDYVQRDDATSGLVNDPRLGMIGASYGGANQYAAAAVDRRIDTLVTQETWTKLEYALAPNNADLDDDLNAPTPGVTKLGWVSLFSAAGAAQPLQHPDVFRPASTCPGFRSEACANLAELVAQGYPSGAGRELMASVSALDFADAIKVPVFIDSGVGDSLFNVKEAVALYRKLKARGVPVKMEWFSWGHGNGNCVPPGPACAGVPVPGELDASQPLELTFQGREYLAWFDRWLRGSPVSTGPEFVYYRSWIPSRGSEANGYQYGGADGYPVGHVQRLFLSGSGDLVGSSSAVVPGETSLLTSPVWTTSFSELSALDRSAPVFDLAGSAVAFTSDVLTRDTDVVGEPVLDITLDSPLFAAVQSMGPAGQLVLFAKLYDVDQNGQEVLPNRIVSPIRVADVRQPLRIHLPTLVHRFAAGHRIRLVLAQGDSTYRGNTLAATVTVRNGAGLDHVLSLPVVE